MGGVSHVGSITIFLNNGMETVKKEYGPYLTLTLNVSNSILMKL